MGFKKFDLSLESFRKKMEQGGPVAEMIMAATGLLYQVYHMYRVDNEEIPDEMKKAVQDSIMENCTTILNLLERAD